MRKINNFEIRQESNRIVPTKSIIENIKNMKETNAEKSIREKKKHNPILEHPKFYEPIG